MPCPPPPSISAICNDQTMAGCTCDEQCPHALDCTCIEIILSGGLFHCFCDCHTITTHLKVLPAEQVSLSIRAAELGKVAAFISQFVDRELIPASRVRDNVTTEIETSTLGEVIDRLGLVMLPGPRAANHTAD